MTEEQQPKHLYRLDQKLYASDEKLQALSDAFCALFAGDVENLFGHNLFSDQNWDGADYCIEAIDGAFDTAVEWYGYVMAKTMRDAAYHMLHVFKIIDDYYTGMADAITDGTYEDA